MAAAVDMMLDEPSWLTILTNFGLSARARDRLVQDYPMASDLMASNIEQIKAVVSHQNKLYRSHSTPNQRCYINTAQLNRIIAFYRWTIFAIKDAHAFYDTGSVTDFDLAWVTSVIEDYLIPDPAMTPQSTPLSVAIPTFSGTNWHQVKLKTLALLSTRTGNAGIPLTYLVRPNDYCGRIRRIW